MMNFTNSGGLSQEKMMTNMKEPKADREGTPTGMPIHMYLTEKGLVMDQGPAWFWKQFLEFFHHLGYYNPKIKTNDKIKKQVKLGKVYDTLKMFNSFTNTWKFTKLMSYVTVRDFSKAYLLDIEATQGQYFCYVDVLFEGDENAFENTAYCILRVNFVITIPKHYNPDNVKIKLDALNDVEIIKSPMQFLIEHNYTGTGEDE